MKLETQGFLASSASGLSRGRFNDGSSDDPTADSDGNIFAEWTLH